MQDVTPGSNLWTLQAASECGNLSRLKRDVVRVRGHQGGSRWYPDHCNAVTKDEGVQDVGRSLTYAHIPGPQTGSGQTSGLQVWLARRGSTVRVVLYVYSEQ